MAAGLLRELMGRGLTVTVEGDHLRVKPVDRLDLELVDWIAQHRAEIRAELADFGALQAAVCIRSSLLDADIWLVPDLDAKHLLEAEGLVCFLPAELAHLRGLSPEAARRIHSVKAALPSQVVAIEATAPPKAAPVPPAAAARTEPPTTARLF